LAFHQTYGLETTVVRPFNAYGPRSHFAGAYGELIPRLVILIRTGKQPVIFGDGSHTRDFTYVEDTASGLLAAAQCDELVGDSINLAHGQEVSVGEVTRLLCELNGVPCNPKHIDERPGDIRRLGCNTAKSRKYLNGVADTNIKEGLKRYLTWLDSQNLDYATMTAELTERNWLV
jgi:UDP-glucose 4-epimerase